MSESVERFYDDLAADYHCIYADWESAIERQSSALDQLIQCESSARVPVVLDCSCGIGTQTIGLAQRGYKVFASDLSPKAVARAELEAAKRGLNVRFAVADIRELECVFDQQFDVVISCDTRYRAMRRNELTAALESVGFAKVAWHEPEQSGYFQPIVTAQA